MAAGPTVKKLLSTYKGKIRLVIKNYPYKYHDYSHLAAEASLAAGDQGKYWEMHDIMIKKSPRLDKKSLMKYAKEVGLDLNLFTDSIDKKKHAAKIERDSKLAVDMNIFGTPAFFINGRKVMGNQPYEELKKIVDEELKSKGK